MRSCRVPVTVIFGLVTRLQKFAAFGPTHHDLCRPSPCCPVRPAESRLVSFCSCYLIIWKFAPPPFEKNTNTLNPAAKPCSDCSLTEAFMTFSSELQAAKVNPQTKKPREEQISKRRETLNPELALNLPELPPNPAAL